MKGNKDIALFVAKIREIKEKIMEDTFVFITVDLTRELRDYTIEEYTKHNGMSIDSSHELSHKDFDIFFSNDRLLHREVRNSYKPLDKQSHKQILKLRESLIDIDLDLHQTIDSLLLDDDTFTHIELFNKLKYEQIVQLLNLTIAQSHLKPVIKQEVTLCIDERAYEDYKHYLVPYLVDMYTFNTPVPNMQVLPTYAAFSKRVRGIKCFY